MKHTYEPPGVIDDDDMPGIYGGNGFGANPDFSVFLFCGNCGRKTKMQMLSLQWAICETCHKTSSTQMNL